MLLRAKAESSFEEVLARIASERRDITAWEGECLRAALVMMAMDDYRAAKQALRACSGASGQLAGAKCALGIEDFSGCLAVLKGMAYRPAITH